MGYKKSEYNIEVAKLKNGETLIHNTYTCAFGLMDKNAENIYRNIENLNVTEQSFLEGIEIEVLKKNGFIVDSERDELKEIILASRNYRYHISKSILTLVIAPTLNCNMKCPYCHEYKKNICMNNETKKLLIEYIKSKISSIKVLYIIWFGGEPLLELPTIEELSEEIISLCNEYKVHYKAEIITNGILMIKDVAVMLKEKCHISQAQITIDGTKTIHDERRKLIDGGDSFSSIINNIKVASNYISIKIRVNVDKKNIENMSELMDFFEMELPKSVKYYFSPVRNDGCNAKDKSCLETKEYLDFFIPNIESRSGKV